MDFFKLCGIISNRGVLKQALNGKLGIIDSHLRTHCPMICPCLVLEALYLTLSLKNVRFCSPNPICCDYLEMGWEVGGRFKREETNVSP